MSVGRARAHGAISIVNAIATGKGASLAIALETEARVELLEETDEITVTIHPDASEDPRLAREVVRHVCARLGAPAYGARIDTTSTIPVSRGLKSSSAAANAIALATNAALKILEGRSLPDKDVLDAAIDAALAAGVTITGAYDDACASFHGALCVTDNKARKLLLRTHIDEDVVAVLHVPPAKTRKSSVRDRPYGAIAPLAEQAWALALKGEWAQAMTLNGFLYAPLYESDARLTLDALSRGARAASVSGTGPAVAAIAPRSKAPDVAAALSVGGERALIVELATRKAEVL